MWELERKTRCLRKENSVLNFALDYMCAIVNNQCKYLISCNLYTSLQWTWSPMPGILNNIIIIKVVTKPPELYNYRLCVYKIWNEMCAPPHHSLYPCDPFFHCVPKNKTDLNRLKLSMYEVCIYNISSYVFWRLKKVFS